MRRLLRRTKTEPERDPLKWHIDFIVELARVMRPSVYVELGVHRAELFNRVIPHAGQLIGVDTDPDSARHVLEAPNVRFVLGATEEFADEVRDSGLRIDMLFIDADHSRDAVLHDFRSYLPAVNPHGLILLHDTHPGDSSLIEPGWCGDAYQAVEQLQASAAEFEMMTIPRSPGLTLCRKRRAQLSWMEPTQAGSPS